MALFLLAAFAFPFPFEINSTKHNPIVGYHPDGVYKLCLSEEATSLCLPPSPAFKGLTVQGAGSPCPGPRTLNGLLQLRWDEGRFLFILPRILQLQESFLAGRICLCKAVCLCRLGPGEPGLVSACGPPLGWFRQRPWGHVDLLSSLYYVPLGRKHPLNRAVGTENNTQQSPVKTLRLVTDLKSRLES